MATRQNLCLGRCCLAWKPPHLPAHHQHHHLDLVLLQQIFPPLPNSQNQSLDMSIQTKLRLSTKFLFLLEAVELRMELEWEERERKGAADCGFMSLWALLGRKEEGEATAPHSQHATRRKAGGNHLARHATAAGLPHGLANLRNLRTRAALPYIALLTLSSFFFFFFQFCRGQ